MNTYCELSASHKCENEAGLKHFIKHGVIQGCAGCCRFCLNKDTCEYACAYVKRALEPAQKTEPAAPGFDFGADDQTNALLLQDAQTFITGNMARIMAAKHAHDLTANHYQGSWGKWCAAVGISRDTGDRMVSVAAQCGNIQLEGKSILDVQPMKLLYAAAKPSTPAEIKQAVFSGDITSYKEYQELMDQLKTKDAQLEAAHADISGLKDRAAAAEAERDEACASQRRSDKNCIRLGLKASQEKERADKAEQRAKDAESQLSGSRQVAEAAKLRADKLKAENDALKKQPIEAVVDEEEVQRQAEAMSRKAVQEARAQTAEAQAQLRQFQQAADGFLAPEQACAQQAKIIADSMRSMYLGWFGLASNTGTPLARMAAPIYQVCDEIRESLEEDTTINPTAAGSEEDAEREALFE